MLVFSDESRFNLSYDDGRGGVWSTHGERFISECPSQAQATFFLLIGSQEFLFKIQSGRLEKIKLFLFDFVTVNLLKNHLLTYFI